MRYYVGVDWGDAQHAVWVSDEAGGCVAACRVAHEAEALAEWGRQLDEWRAQGVGVWAAIERPDGPVVSFLLDHGVVVYPINPKALDRARDRFRGSHAKSDPFDAHVLAEFLRTDQGHLAPLHPSSPAAQELKLLTDDYRRLVRDQTRVVNELIATLKAYYPRAAELWPEWTAPVAQEFLATYAVPAQAAALSERTWRQFAKRHRLSEARTAEGWTLLQRPQVPMPAHVVRAKARLMTALLEQLRPLSAAVRAYRDTIADFFGALPAAAWARTLPVSAHGTTVATIWARLGDAPDRWQSWQHLQAHAGVTPVTVQSGRTRIVTFRFACDKQLRDAVARLAFLSLPRCPWAAAYYRRQRARGHRHHHALRALAAKWVKILFILWQQQTPYDEPHHLAALASQHLRASLGAGALDITT